MLTSKEQIDNISNQIQFSAIDTSKVVSILGFISVMNLISYIRQLDVCVLQNEISRSGKQDNHFKTYLKNKTDGAIVYVVEKTNQTDDNTKIEIKMVNEVFTKLADFKDQEKSAVGSKYLEDELATPIFKIDGPEIPENENENKLIKKEKEGDISYSVRDLILN